MNAYAIIKTGAHLCKYLESSSAYDAIGERYAMIMSDIQLESPQFKEGLAGVVAALHDGFEQGFVESVDCLPDAKQVREYDSLALVGLLSVLDEVYFPAVKESQEQLQIIEPSGWGYFGPA